MNEVGKTGGGYTPGPWIAEAGGLIGLGAPVIASVAGTEHVAWITRGLPGGGWPDAHLIAAAPDLVHELIKSGGEDGFLLAQIATFVGGMADAYRLTGDAKETAERYFDVLHRLSESHRAAIAKALNLPTEDTSNAGRDGE